VLDSTPLYDAVATMDTVTLIRSAIRGLLKVADDDLAVVLRGVLASGDDYASPSKPIIDWDDEAARAELIDSRARDGMAVVMELSGGQLDPAVTEAACLLLAVLGQDLEERDDGVFGIARRVAPDRVISTVDPETRHGHKTSAHSFDGWKAHVAVDPDSELVTATAVTPGNVGDAVPAAGLLADVVNQPAATDQPAATTEPVATNEAAVAEEPPGAGPSRPVVYGDNAYGTGDLHRLLEESGVEDRLKTQSPSAAAGRFTKDRLAIDLETETVTCPAGVTVTIHRHKDGSGTARFKSPAPPARCANPARPRHRVASSTSTATSESSLSPGPDRPIRPGETTTDRPARKSSASSPTSRDAGTGADGHASAAESASPPTSACSPPPTTSSVSPSLGPIPPQQDGRRHETGPPRHPKDCPRRPQRALHAQSLLQWPTCSSHGIDNTVHTRHTSPPIHTSHLGVTYNGGAWTAAPP
jgi:hypothetical protein